MTNRRLLKDGLLADVAVYGSARTAVQLLSLLTLPVVARSLTPADYGVLEAIATTTAAAGLLVSLQLDSAVQRYWYDDGSADRRGALLATALAAAACTGLLVFGLALALHDAILGLLLGRDSGYEVALVLAAASLPLGVVASHALEVLRLERMRVAYSGVTVSVAVIGAATTLVLVGGADAGVTGVMAAGLVSSIAAFLAALLFVLPRLRRPDPRMLRPLLGYALPLLPVAASTLVLQLLDRYVLLAHVSAEALGLYGMGARLTNILLLLVIAFGAAWSPHFLAAHARDANAEREARGDVVLVVVAVMTGAAVCLTAVAQPLLRVLAGDAYVDAAEVVGLLALSNGLIGVNVVVMTGITIARRTGLLARGTVIAAGVHVCLLLVLVPRLGAQGAAVATLAAYLLLTALYWRWSQRVDPAPLPGLPVLCLLAWGGISVSLITWTPAGTGRAGIVLVQLLLVLAVIRYAVTNRRRTGAAR